MIRHLLLAAALVLGQSLVIAHASEHHTLAAQHECAVCVHAQNHDAAPAADVPHLHLHTVATRPATAVTSGFVAASRHAYRSRGPPESLLN